jgi:hypothetical protein
MHTQGNSQIVLAAAIVIAAVMICATLLALNVRTTYDYNHGGLTYNQQDRLLSQGCRQEQQIWIYSCPLWAQP